MTTKKTTDPKAQCVLEAATTVFLQHGFSAATTDMIQKEAGVSKATLYNRYPNKEALFTAVIEERCRLTIMEVNSIKVSSNNLEETLQQIGHTYLRIILSPMGIALFRTVAAEAVRFPEMGRTFFSSGPQAIVEIISGHILRAEERGEIKIQPLGAPQAALIFNSMLRAEGQMEGLMFPGSVPSDALIEHWAKTAVQTFMRAFGV